MTPDQLDQVTEALALVIFATAFYAIGTHWITGRGLELAWRYFRRSRRRGARLRREARR